jgi:hypothetical protein
MSGELTAGDRGSSRVDTPDIDSPVKQKRPSSKKRIVDSDSDEADEPAPVKAASKPKSQASASGKDGQLPSRLIRCRKAS